jgi:hypothetical protein
MVGCIRFGTITEHFSALDRNATYITILRAIRTIFDITTPDLDSKVTYFGQFAYHRIYQRS